MQSIENCLINLHSIRGLNNAYGDKANRLIGWYNETGELSKKQIQYAGYLIAGARREKSKGKEKEHYLYAISDGKNVKIGYSINPKSRMRALQTGCAVKLEIVWTLAVGCSKLIAEKQERKLHRYCRAYRKQGEWFGIGCMHLVEQFSIKEKVLKEIAEESGENAIVAAAMLRI